jgi:hypothetical protein
VLQNYYFVGSGGPEISSIAAISGQKTRTVSDYVGVKRSGSITVAARSKA